MNDRLSRKSSYKLRFQETELSQAKFQDVLAKYQILAREALGLFIAKNNAYGSVFLESGVVGISIRIRDKLRRLFSTDETVADEGTTENFLDIANYALMGAMIDFFGMTGSEKCEHLFFVEKTQENDGTKTLRCLFCDEKILLNK